MNLLSPAVETKIANSIQSVLQNKEYPKAADLIVELELEILKSIPERKRISVGRYTVAKALVKALCDNIEENNISIYECASGLYNSVVPAVEDDIWARVVAVGMLAFSDARHLKCVLSFFKRSAASDNWIERECSAGFVHPLIKAYPDEIKHFYLHLLKSDNPFLRRFVSESLRLDDPAR